MLQTQEEQTQKYKQGLTDAIIAKLLFASEEDLLEVLCCIHEQEKSKMDKQITNPSDVYSKSLENLKARECDCPDCKKNKNDFGVFPPIVPCCPSTMEDNCDCSTCRKYRRFHIKFFKQL